jgi:hypothetical protein
MILLGQKVRDKITGFEGVTVSKVEYLNGCIQYGVRPYYSETEMKGEYPKAEYIDEEQLEKLYPESLENEKTGNGDQDSNPKEPPGGLQSARPRK